MESENDDLGRRNFINFYIRSCFRPLNSVERPLDWSNRCPWHPNRALDVPSRPPSARSLDSSAGPASTLPFRSHLFLQFEPTDRHRRARGNCLLVCERAAGSARGRMACGSWTRWAGGWNSCWISSPLSGPARRRIGAARAGCRRPFRPRFLLLWMFLAAIKCERCSLGTRKRPQRSNRMSCRCWSYTEQSKTAVSCSQCRRYQASV